MSTDNLKLYGGPGTGKTKSGMDWLLERVHEGYDAERVAFVSYTNAAVDEAKGRVCEAVGLEPSDLPYSRTLHSLAKRALGINHDGWCADNHLKDFAVAKGYDLKVAGKKADEDGLEEVASSAGSDAGLLAVWDFARHRGITEPYEAYRAFAQYDPDATARLTFPRFRAFVDDYEGWKQGSYLRDYTDLLQELVENPVTLPVSVAVIDEAQDLSPLMWQAADVLFAEAELRATLGDDDQAIYSFSGADPLLMNKRRAREVVKLRKSHRLPRQIVETANWIIRQNDNRESKELEPLAEGGLATRASFLEQLPLHNGETWFLLVRNWKLLSQFTEPLEHLGLPYRVAGGRYSPWSDKGPFRAAQALLALGGGETITVADLWPLVEKTPSANSKRDGVWAHGSKKRLEGLVADKPADPVTWNDLTALGMVPEAFLRVMRRDLTLLEGKVSARDVRAYEAAMRRGTWGETPRVMVGSIHSVKGKEAQNVAVLLGCTGAPARAMLHPWRMEEERRVAYVGATRAQKALYGLLPQPSGGLYPWELLGV